jgi:hypothetical protein
MRKFLKWYKRFVTASLLSLYPLCMLKALQLYLNAVGYFWDSIENATWFYTAENLLGGILFATAHIGLIAGCLVGAAEICKVTKGE